MKKYAYYLAWAIALHLGLLLMFVIGAAPKTKPLQKAEPEIIEAAVLDEDKIIQQVEKLKQKQQARQRRLAEQKQREQQLLEQARRKRLQEERKIRELAEKQKQQALALKKKQAELKRKQAEEKARLESLKKQQAEARKKLERQRLAREKAQRDAEKQRQKALARKKAEEKRKAELARKKAEQARQAELARQREAAAAKTRAKAAQQMTIRASRAIQQKVNNSWIRPMTSSKGLRCTVRVKLLPSGDVMDVRVLKSSGDPIFDRSAENAVRKASPLPVPKDRTVFNQNFRTFTFVFKPE